LRAWNARPATPYPVKNTVFQPFADVRAAADSGSTENPAPAPVAFS
jgi:hypothetical protein